MRGIPRCPSQLEMRLDFPEAIRAGPRGPRRNSRGTPNFLPSLKENHGILPSMQDKTLSHCSVLREIPRSVLKLETVLHTLHETPEVPRHTRPHSKGTPIFPAHLNLSPFAPPHLEMKVDSPALSGKESRRYRCPSRGGQSHIETQQEPSWIVPQSQRH